MNRAHVICTLQATFIASLLLFTSCTQSGSDRQLPTSYNVHVLADISLQPALLDVAQHYKEDAGYNLVFHFAPYADLLPDRPGDSADVYLLANNVFAQSTNPAPDDTIHGRILAYAVPCIVVPQFNPALVSGLIDLKKDQVRLGIPDPGRDVLGQFALEILKKNNLYDALESHLNLVGPSALELAEQVSKKELEAGIGWTVFSNWTQGGAEVVLLSGSEIPRVAAVCAYKAAAPVDSANAARFMTYLNSDRCLDVFRQWGYITSKADLEMYAPIAEIGGKPKF